MAIFTRYSKVMEADGTPMSVRAALGLINEGIEEFFTQEEGSFDPASAFCLKWYEQHGASEGLFGDAQVLSRAKDVTIESLQRAGVLKAAAGKVRLLRPAEYPDDWNPATAGHVTAWEATAYLVAALKAHDEPHAAGLAARLGGVAEDAKKLAYRLYDIASRNGWNAEALDYNNLVAAWTGIQKSAASQGGYVQQRLLVACQANFER